MAEIPDDIVSTVREIFAAHRREDGSGCQNVEAMKDLVSAALVAERNRCVKIAEIYGWGGEISAKVRKSWPEYYQGEKDAGDEIAAAIRGGSHG